MIHEPAAKLKNDKAAHLKSKLGLKLFFVYALIYAGFIFIGVYKPSLMGVRIAWGLNFAIIYGFGLIVLAIVMGFLYHLACSRFEDRLNHKED
jgi:uncharacterized membrane protein (DUF485 family)